MTPEIEAMVIRLERLDLSDARRELSGFLHVDRNINGGFDPASLDRNARLVTAIRERGIKIWGDQK